jgi:nitrite reductase (NADH) small subunit
MSELHWIWLTEVGNVPQREGRLVEIGGRQLAVFNLGERFVVIDNRCPHKGGPLSDGIVAGDSVVCPLHGWKVNLQTGRVGRPLASSLRHVVSHPRGRRRIVVGNATLHVHNDGKAA